MVTELKVEGFKSFALGTRAMSFGSLTFLVGANASGKTNVVSALRFLRTATLHNVEIAEDHSASFHYLWNRVSRVCST